MYNLINNAKAINKKARKQQKETTSSEAQSSEKTKSKPKKNRSVVPVTLLKNGYVNGKLYKTGQHVDVPISMHKYLITTSPEVYQ